MQVSELFAGSSVERRGPDAEVSALVYDSRKAGPGSLFAALRGTHVDGHAHIPAALAAGASAILMESWGAADTHAAAYPGVAWLRAADSRLALAQAAARLCGDPAARLKLVGVTGTNGKTTTVHLLEGIFAAAGLAPGIVGTLGSRHRGADGRLIEVRGGLTTPESVELTRLLADMADAGTQAVAMEVSSHALAQHRVGGLAFDVGVFTNLTHDHLDYHATLEAYFAAKALLVRRYLKDGGTAVLNIDDPRVAALADERLAGERVVAFSSRADARARVFVTRTTHRRDGITLELQVDGASWQVVSPLLGMFNVENILAAVATAVALDLPADAVAAGVAGVVSVPGRLEKVSRPGEPLVLVDYAHTPDALTKALAAVRDATPGRLLCVFGCGGDRDPDKRGAMGEAAAASCDFTVVTNDNPRSEDPALIADAIEAGLRRAGREVQRDYVVVLDRADAIAHALGQATPRDTVLIAGKGHEDYQIIGGERRFFDDRVQAREVLRGLRRSS